MPERNERFFWLYGSKIDENVASAINDSNIPFLEDWQECPLEYKSCVDARGLSDRLWLFRLNCGIGNNKLARKFNIRFQKYIATIPTHLNFSDNQIKLKRRSNFPTPLILEPLSGWPSTDIGLHAVNDEYNGMLVTYSYYQGKYTQPPHLQVGDVRRLLNKIETVWREVACDCNSGICKECNCDGCYSCFERDCIYCFGTGWKKFAVWAATGFNINYESGYPVAELQKTVL